MNTLERYDALREHYLRRAERNNLTETTVSNYTNVLGAFRKFLEQRDVPGGYVGYADIEAWIDALTEDGRKPSVVRQYLVVLRQFFEYACKRYISLDLRYPENPVSTDFYPKQVPQSIPEILTDKQITQLWKDQCLYPTHRENFPRNYAIVVLILTTGLRNKEVLDLTPAAVDFERGEILVKEGKGRKDRIVDMPPLCAAALKSYLASGIRPEGLDENEPLFGTTAAKVNRIGVQRSAEWHRGGREWLSNLIDRHVYNQCGARNVTSHDLRHVFATVALNATGNLAELQSALGHTSPVVTERYSGRLMQRRRRESAKAVLAAQDAAAEKLEKSLEKAEQEAEWKAEQEAVKKAERKKILDMLKD